MNHPEGSTITLSRPVASYPAGTVAIDLEVFDNHYQACVMDASGVTGKVIPLVEDDVAI